MGLDLQASDLEPDGANGVWPENKQAVEAFLSVQSQWRTVCRPDGSLLATGLDYSGVKVGLKMAGFKIRPQLWTEIRVIEQAARSELNGGRQ